jgi:EAL domain-containing protein (putative c-di-GMP-specific phosphodiesterase class I)
LETDLWQALERQEFVVHYQPIVSAVSGQITGVEALLRWQHPQRGLLPPAEFIQLAEETGLIVPIGEWLLHTVCAQTRAWHMAGHTSLSVAVNMSARQLKQQDIMPLIKGALEKTGLPAQSLILEITEGILTKELDLTVLNELKELGLKISVDDFGIGSSLECLKEFPLGILKIDQSFVKGITTEASDRAIVSAMINMAHNLNLTVVAEGVEAQEQLAFLQAQHCNEIQGYFFSQPVPAKELTNLLQEGQGLVM